MQQIAIRKKTINDNQKALYFLISERLSSNRPITLEDSIKIWTERVCRQIRNGKPHRYNFFHHKDEKGEWQGGYTELSKDQIRISSVEWLVKTIGVLVLKGFLEIIPKIQLLSEEHELINYG